MKPLSLLTLLTLFVAQPLFAAAPVEGPQPDADGWYTLFDGSSLDDWKVTEDHPGSFRLEDGMLVANGERAHLFYNGPVMDHDFKDFEFQAEVMTTPKSNSGIYIHAKYQKDDWPDTGYEAQVNSTQGDPQKTGGLYDVVKVLDSPSKDGEWFTYTIIVKGKTITTQVNGKTQAEYDEKDKAELDHRSRGSDLSSGTFAIQAHDPGSKVFYKNIKVKPLD